MLSSLYLCSPEEDYAESVAFELAIALFVELTLTSISRGGKAAVKMIINTR
jgi:hypothetical protein